MRPKRLQECLDSIRWPPATLAASLQREPEEIDQWLNGAQEIPSEVASWIEALCFTHEAADLMRPVMAPPSAPAPSIQRRAEHIPVYAYDLLRTLSRGPVSLTTLFGTDDEGAVFFLVSRGLAAREEGLLAISASGRKMGEVLAAPRSHGEEHHK
ncbi:hypothetical protein [Paradevosia shaoguanensis]|uniref:Uncharacterized protein n=1 Tax=Paradevosia shaoguanensis TaxID=1335043 RepID=A0AA41QHW6_9HYPH|nr:hypothetical protein [Paradevosia shaoguanensis]MCF1740721.1 hypothetical protein [Paradevosia shaoguanensis]MCI0125205.1 hypothetical protein [Paradevosia shaoguanensis]